MNPTNDTCPICSSSRLWNMSTRLEDRQCIILISCLDCNSRFEEIYNLEYQHTVQIEWGRWFNSEKKRNIWNNKIGSRQRNRCFFKVQRKVCSKNSASCRLGHLPVLGYIFNYYYAFVVWSAVSPILSELKSGIAISYPLFE